MSVCSEMEVVVNVEVRRVVMVEDVEGRRVVVVDEVEGRRVVVVYKVEGRRVLSRGTEAAGPARPASLTARTLTLAGDDQQWGDGRLSTAVLPGQRTDTVVVSLHEDDPSTTCSVTACSTIHSLSVSTHHTHSASSLHPPAC